jgi:hypothetical protein
LNHAEVWPVHPTVNDWNDVFDRSLPRSLRDGFPMKWIDEAGKRLGGLAAPEEVPAESAAEER